MYCTVLYEVYIVRFIKDYSIAESRGEVGRKGLVCMLCMRCMNGNK
jgi:hypothetical protein